eukprot:TRINITY_DN710_c0_g1_i1.p1 TRINITY_DN710_c0_g1~~TRINITY_DN710_c0_g1_i1.p1  ORF type:complete len:161 (+),score=35.21 TRINITY_DN710_c0_g1_i1:61-483(+)
MAKTTEELKELFEAKTQNLFDDESIEAAFKEFDKISQGDPKTVTKDGFVTFFKTLFPDQTEEGAFITLNNAYFLDKIFEFCDKNKWNKLTLENITLGLIDMFDPDSPGHTDFKFQVYDIDRNNTLTKAGIKTVLKNSWIH